MGRVGFRGRTRRYGFLLVRARSGAGVGGATPCRQTGCVIFGGFHQQLRHRVPDLCAYATKMRAPLLRANTIGWMEPVSEFKTFDKIARPYSIKGLQRPISYGRNSPRKTLIGYARVSTYGQTLDSQ